MNQELIDKYIQLRRSNAPQIDPQKTALVIIDMQEYQIRKEWALYKAVNNFVPGLLDYFVAQVNDVVEPNIIRLIGAFRENGLKIVYTKFSSFSKDGGDLAPGLKRMNNLTKNAYGEPSFPYFDHPASEIVQSLKPEDNDLIIVKNTSSAFASTNLDDILKNMGIEHLIVAGVVTNMCIEGTARIGSELGFYVKIVEDACTAWTPEIHNVLD